MHRRSLADSDFQSISVLRVMLQHIVVLAKILQLLEILSQKITHFVVSFRSGCGIARNL